MLNKKPIIKENTQVQIKDKKWFLSYRSGDATATGKTLAQAISRMESRYHVKVRLPLRYKGFTEISAEEFQTTVSQAGG